MKKIKIFDTNVFLTDPKALFAYPRQLVVIPISVIEELDDKKKGQTELARNARETLRKIDKLSKRGNISGSNKKSKRSNKEELGIELNNKGRLKIELNHTDRIPEGLNKSKVDNRILAVALYYKETYPDSEVEVISIDTAVRIKTKAEGIKASDFLMTESISTDHIYKGYRIFTMNEGEIQEWKQGKKIYCKDDPRLKGINHNEYVKLTVDKEIDEKSTFILAKYNTTNSQLVPINNKGLTTIHEKWKIKLDNDEQMMALDALLDPTIPLVTITGKAGTGKTLLAIASALQLTSDEGGLKYSKILISRPVFPMGKDIGYLPGDINEKLNPWMQPIFDNLEFLYENNYSSHGKKNGTVASHTDLIKNGTLKVEPLMYIRGRSIPHQFMIIDEAQNLTLHEIKTIITRAGKGTKIIFTGDPEQIDNPYVDSLSNGLTQIVEKMKDSKLAAHVNLIKGERSELAEYASEILK